MVSTSDTTDKDAPAFVPVSLKYIRICYRGCFYTTDRDGIFIHDNKMLCCQTCEDSYNVDFKFVRDLTEEEIIHLMEMGEINVAPKFAGEVDRPLEITDSLSTVSLSVCSEGELMECEMIE